MSRRDEILAAAYAEMQQARADEAQADERAELVVFGLSVAVLLGFLGALWLLA